MFHQQSSVVFHSLNSYLKGIKIFSIFFFFEEYKDFQGFPDSSVGKESARNVGDPCSIPGLRRSNGEGIGYPLQYSSLDNSMDCTVHGVSKSRTRLRYFDSPTH